MERYLEAFAMGTLATWVTLLVVLPIARKLADFALPGWGGLLWQAALVAAIVNLVHVGILPLGAVWAWLASLVAFWSLMVKWFRVDFFAAIVILAVNLVVRLVLVILIAAL